MLKKPVHVVLEEWVFSLKANFDTNSHEQQPEMLNRLLAGILHPMLYIGYGLEFRYLTILFGSHPTDMLNPRFAACPVL